MIKLNNKGFTMIELVVILVLIGLISAIAIPKYLDVTTKSKEKALKGALSSLRGAVDMSYAKTVLDGSPAYPSLNAALFKEGLPDDVYTPDSSVTYTVEDPIATFSGAGGWLYNDATGEIRVNLAGKTDW
jgi:MSHA pilin protein MshA